MLYNYGNTTTRLSIYVCKLLIVPTIINYIGIQQINTWVTKTIINDT